MGFPAARGGLARLGELGFFVHRFAQRPAAGLIACRCSFLSHVCPQPLLPPLLCFAVARPGAERWSGPPAVTALCPLLRHACARGHPLAPSHRGTLRPRWPSRKPRAQAPSHGFEGTAAHMARSVALVPTEEAPLAPGPGTPAAGPRFLSPQTSRRPPDADTMRSGPWAYRESLRPSAQLPTYPAAPHPEGCLSYDDLGAGPQQTSLSHGPQPQPLRRIPEP